MLKFKVGEKGQGICKKCQEVTEGTYTQLYCNSPQGRLVALICDSCETIIGFPNQPVEHHAGWHKWTPLSR